jgi:hypothetical protein
MPKQATAREYYNEIEAAEYLGITLGELYRLLDEHIFTDGAPRPQKMEFRYSDLLLLSVWSSPPRLLQMPSRS